MFFSCLPFLLYFPPIPCCQALSPLISSARLFLRFCHWDLPLSVVGSSNPLYISTHDEQWSQHPFHALHAISRPGSPFSGHKVFWGTAECQLQDLEGCFPKTQQAHTVQVRLLSSGCPSLGMGKQEWKNNCWRRGNSLLQSWSNSSSTPFPPAPICKPQGNPTHTAKHPTFTISSVQLQRHLSFWFKGDPRRFCQIPHVLTCEAVAKQKKALVQICEVRLYWDVSWGINI